MGQFAYIVTGVRYDKQMRAHRTSVHTAVHDAQPYYWPERFFNC